MLSACLWLKRRTTLPSLLFNMWPALLFANVHFLTTCSFVEVDKYGVEDNPSFHLLMTQVHAQLAMTVAWLAVELRGERERHAAEAAPEEVCLKVIRHTLEQHIAKLSGSQAIPHTCICISLSLSLYIYIYRYVCTLICTCIHVHLPAYA